jgi:hypothetical protein
VKAKLPPTTAAVMGETAEPPLSVEADSICPELIALAVGQVTVGVALFTCTLTVLLTGE